MSSALRGTELYKHDLVKSKTSGNIGMVSSCYDDKNEVGVIWIDETDSIECINNVEVLDRRLVLGEYVASTSNPMGQIGNVVDMEISVDVLPCDGAIIKNVNAKRLRRVGYFAVGDYVILGPWLGRVQEILDSYRVTFDDGSAYDIMNAEHKSRNFPFYPGQRVKVVSSSNFKKLCHQLEGTVTEVTVGSIIVCWVASVDSGSATSPNEEQNPEDLKLLNCFAHTKWQLGDWCILPELKEEFTSSRTRSEGSQVLSSKESLFVCIESADEYCPLRRKVIQNVVVKRARKDIKKDDEFERAVVIVNTKTSVDVVWQDGGLERCRNSRSLIPIESLDDHQFLVNEYVVEKALDDPSELKRAGVIENVNEEEKTACVKWFKRVEDPTAFDDEKMVSAYELETHPDFDFCYGDVVLRLSSIAQVIPTSEASFMSCIGTITKFRNGGIEVTWADGVVSMVGPQEIYVVDSDDDESIEDDVDGASRETDKDDEIETLEDATEVHSQSTSDDDSDYDESIGDHAESWETEEDNEFETLENVTEISYADDEIKISEQGGYELLSVPDAISNVKLDARRFDITSDPYDHHYATVQFNADNKWLKKVVNDWNMLKNNLPDDIYVRVYEDRMDLLRVGIVGADGTPYHDGIFFFDFHLPSEYPAVPPHVYYHSGGWRINPNLYNEGKVCLSLLNTWSGKGNEMWDPSSSNILQVLLSLQGLVLNSRPYFNEAGYEKQIGTSEGEQRSLSYNENTFLLSCKTMMHFMRKPPKDFEDIVQKHFRTRGYNILKACDAYMKGYLVASLAKDATVTSSSVADSNTTGFKIMLTKLLSKLYSSLSDIGANCKDFEHFQSLGT